MTCPLKPLVLQILSLVPYTTCKGLFFLLTFAV